MMLLSRGIGLAVLFSGAVFAQDVPKADLFVGFSPLFVHSAQTIPAFTAYGGASTFAYNFNNHIGLEAEFSGYHNGDIDGKQYDTTAYGFLFGPRFSLGRSKRVDPYFHVLWGGVYGTTSISSSSVLIPTPLSAPAASTPVRYKASQTNFAMAAGGGLDIKLNRTVVLRLFQADYFLTRFEAPSVLYPTGPTSNRNQNNFRLATGFAFNFGGERPSPPPPPPPPAPRMRTCSGGITVSIDQECPKQSIGLGIAASQSEVCPGDLSRVAINTKLPEGAVTQWSINGEPISQSTTLDFGSTGRNPGVYRVELKVAAEGYNEASAQTAIRVREYVPPSGSLSVTPAEIWVGDKATLSASFSMGQCGGALGQVTFSAPEGSFTGNQYDSNGVRFDPADVSEQRKTVTVTAKVSDQRGSGSAAASVVVKQKGATLARRLPDIIFPANNDRVNNCGKRVLLEELKGLFEGDPGGNVVFVGHLAETEPTVSSLDLKRALNAAAVISAGQEICSRFSASQILVKGVGTADDGVDFQPHFCGTSTNVVERQGQTAEQNDSMAKFRRVEVWFVPTGGVPPKSATDTKDAATLGVSSLGCPR